MITPLLAIELPIRTVSEANRASSEHWRSRQQRAKQQCETTAWELSRVRDRIACLRLPLTIVLVRYSTGSLDDGNLGASLKHVQDGITDALGAWMPRGEGPRKMSSKRGAHHDDSDRLTWHYAQRKCKRGQERVEALLYEPGAVARWMLSRMPTETSELERFVRAHATQLDALLASATVVE